MCIRPASFRVRALALTALCLVGTPGVCRAEEPAANEGKAAKGDAEEPELQHGAKVIAVPVPVYNPQLDLALGLIGMVTYRLDESDPVSPPSSTMLFGLAATNGTFLLAGAQHVYWHRDDNRAALLAAGGHINADFYGAGSFTSNGIIFPLGVDAFVVAPQYLRRVWDRLYLGGRYVLFLSDATFQAPAGAPETVQTYFPLTTRQTASGLGAVAEYDSRDNRFSATRGFYVPVDAVYYPTALGSTTSYGVFQVAYNSYHSLHGKNLILAVRGMVQTATSNTPVYLLPAVGAGPDLRGYAAGRYRDYVFLAAQAELRWYFWRGLGAVIFGGVGSTTSGFDALTEGTVLPSYGLGLRYMLHEKERLLARIDYGRGNEDGMFYFSVSEAF
jgi:hypothetical protein